MKATILVGDVLTRIKEIPDQTIQCCVTSPPYWGLRDYGTGTWLGGNQNCDHQGKPMATKANINKNCGTGNDVKNAQSMEFYKDFCGKCGAERVDEQLGLEPTPEQYVENMVAVFREVRRILKDDGVLWLNLGDSYGNPSAGRNDGNHRADARPGGMTFKAVGTTKHTGNSVKPKDLVGIPWRVAFALQQDGWWLRQDIIWHKPNPMPESVTDRCTKAHEYLFMLTKSTRYYFNNDAIKEQAITPPSKRDKHAEGYQADYAKGDRFSPGERVFGADGKRNKRSVWSIPTKPFRGAHFAVMPEALCEPPILATSQPDDLVFDPFTGSGTVATVALRHGRNYLGIELNPDYSKIAYDRITQDQPMFNNVEISQLEGHKL